MEGPGRTGRTYPTSQRLECRKSCPDPRWELHPTSSRIGTNGLTACTLSTSCRDAPVGGAPISADDIRPLPVQALVAGGAVLTAGCR